MSPPKDTRYLFIDMNAFFASCEQEASIGYRHKPIAVTPVNAATGCIISASYEAKAYGVKTGMSVKDAKFTCPTIIIKESNVNLYLSFHKKLVETLIDYSPFVTVRSVDEAAIRLSLSEQNSLAARELAQKIKLAIGENLGKYLRSSIGIGPNVWLAKMAAESDKPDGLVEVKLEDLPDFYQGLELTDLKGINVAMAKRLNAVGFYRPIDLYMSSSQTLREKIGIVGAYWRLRLHGYDIDVFESRPPKSIGHSHILEPIYRSWSKAWAVCQKLVEKTGRRLREEGLIANGTHLWIRYQGRGLWHKGIKVSPFSNSQIFLKFIDNLWQEAPKDAKPLGIGVKAYGLAKPLGSQLRIWPKMQRLDDLYAAVDKINDRYGSFTIKPANLLFVESSAPNRIAFGRPTST